MGSAAARRAALACAGLGAVGLTLAVASPTFRLRVSEPEVANWYGARYAPSAVAQMAPNELRQVPITVENSGKVAWEHDGPRPVRLAYHWLDARTGAVVRYEGRRTMLPRAVEPGETVALSATVQAPARPGQYVLVWDMLREYIGRGWFSQMGVPPARVTVVVAGAPAPVAPPGADPPRSPQTITVMPGPPGRRDLWGVALTLWRGSPIVGIGPDVFRHTYGPYLGMELWDDRVHTNSLYLELLTGAGVVGLLCFLGLAGAALWAAWGASGRMQHAQCRMQNARPGLVTHDKTVERGYGEAALLGGATLALVAFLGHGLLDVFLAFTPTYALLWVALGAIGGLSVAAGGGARARRARNTDSLPSL